MAIKLQRLNVVKVVESEVKAQALERRGFVRVDEEPDSSKKSGKRSDKPKTTAQGGVIETPTVAIVGDNEPVDPIGGGE